jgi:hypothetical protein
MQVHDGSDNLHRTFRQRDEFGQELFRARHGWQFNGPKVRVEFWLYVLDQKLLLVA